MLGGGGGARQGQSELSYEQIHEKLLELFNAKASFDDVFNWVTVSFSLLKIVVLLIAFLFLGKCR